MAGDTNDRKNPSQLVRCSRCTGKMAWKMRENASAHVRRMSVCVRKNTHTHHWHIRCAVCVQRRGRRKRAPIAQDDDDDNDDDGGII